jgi:hypothetical protein
MSVSEGTFRLYSHVDPPLQAGTYRFRADQVLSATGAAADQLPVEQLDTMVRVRSPRYLLPPDQVLSVFPPANHEGSFGSRLPQVVIKRRTLPWERDLAGQPSTTPWLALVVIAEGEGVLKLNQPVAACVTPGKALPGTPDVEAGAYLEVRTSVVERVFPTRKDVPLLAHAREVDINDTELMLGDDDGYLAVVVANRLPLAGRDEHGDEVPMKYLACPVNLEEQFDALLPQAPPPALVSWLPLKVASMAVDTAAWDKVKSGQSPVVTASMSVESVGLLDGPLDAEHDVAGADEPRDAARALSLETAAQAYTPAPHLAGTVFEASTAYSLDDATQATSNIYQEMAQGFALEGMVAEGVVAAFADPRLRFPVLLHWSFTTTGDTTFERLMQGLDSGLMGTVPEQAPTGSDARQPPLEVVETGHVGLAHRTREGDEVRVWYRGPLVPHPTIDPTSHRLPLAHASDQLRIVVPDGREDLSIAAAFEIGRLLALAHPSTVAALLRWRQSQYQVARRGSIFEGVRSPFDELLADSAFGDIRYVERDLGLQLGGFLSETILTQPQDVRGPPRTLHDPRRSLDLDDVPVALVAAGLGLDADLLADGGIEALPVLAASQVPVIPVGQVFGGVNDLKAPLQLELGIGLVDLVSGAMAPSLFDIAGGPTIPRTSPRTDVVPDRLDAMLGRVDDEDAAAGEEGPR